MAAEKRLIDANSLLLKAHWVIRSDGTRVFVVHAEDVENAPPVDAVEVVHGRWIYGTRAAVCSVCGFERNLDDNFGAAIACPNCGAKMDLEEPHG